MNRVHGLRNGVALVAVMGGVAVLAAPRDRTVAEVSPAVTAGTEWTSRAGLSTRGLDSLRRLVLEGDVFRATRRPARVTYQPVAEAALHIGAAPATPAPALHLRGIVWSSRPAALLEGIPGSAEAVVMEVGDNLAGFTVIEVMPDSVRVAGTDTTWTLTLKAPWNR